jgi:hypothetical protein
MILDKELQFSDSVALTASANSSVVTLGAASRLFAGEPLDVVINVEVAADFTSADETYSFALQTDDAVGFPSATTLISRAILATALTAGTKHTLAVPIELNQEGFLRVAYTLAGTSPSVTVSAHLSPRSFHGNSFAYPDNSTIS